MKKIAVFFVVVFAAVLSSRCISAGISSDGSTTAPEAQAPLTLADCYNLALKQSETIAINEELIREAEAHFIQALSMLAPHVSFASKDTKQDPVGTSSLSSLAPSTSSERKFVFKQALFSGFKEIAGITGSRHEHNQRTNEKLRAEQLLFVDVADSFYLLVEVREDLKALGRVRAALIERIGELKARERLGRSRISEVINARAQLYNVDAEIESVRNEETLARQLLEFLTGRPLGKVVDEGALFTPLEAVRPRATSQPLTGFPSLKPEIYYLLNAKARPDVKAAEEAWKLSKKMVTVAASDFFPTADLEGNYYTQRTGFSKNSKWDVAFKVDVPIFEGTETLGAVKEAEAKAREKELEFSRRRREAVLDIKDAYANLTASILRHDALKRALTFARLNYHLQTKDYRLNLVSNLDVLTSIQTWQDAQRNYISVLYGTKRFYWRLAAASSDSPPERMLNEPF